MTIETESIKSTRKFNLKQARILSIATRVININGLEDATISRIAAAADIAPTSLTYYYKHKGDLAAACYRYAFQEWDRMIARAQKAATPEGRLRSLIQQYFQLQRDIGDGKTAPLVVFGLVRSLTDTTADEVFAGYTRFFRSIRGLIQPENFDNSQWSRLNACTHFVISQINWSPFWLSLYQRPDYDRSVNRLMDILTVGVNPDRYKWVTADEMTHEVPNGSRDIFLKAAAEMINDNGYRGASVNKIAAELKLTKGSLYHHYATKDELVIACYEQTFSKFDAVLNRSRTVGNHREQLNHAISNLVRFQLSSVGPLLSSSAIHALPSAKREQIRGQFSQISESLAQIATDGMIDRSLRPVDPLIVSQMLISIVSSSSELPRWVPGVDRTNADSLYVRPFFEGIFNY